MSWLIIAFTGKGSRAAMGQLVPTIAEQMGDQRSAISESRSGSLYCGATRLG